jgi:lysophospholipase L1-like esterase
VPAYKPSWNISDSVITTQIIPIINKVAQSEGLEVVDLHTLFDNTDGQQMQSDGIHPTEKGCSQMAKAIGAAIKQ